MKVEEIKFHVSPSLAEKIDNLLAESKVTVNTGLATMMYVIALQAVESAKTKEELEVRTSVMCVLLSMAMNKAYETKEEEDDRTIN